MLSTLNHDRNKLGLTYIYPVLSRRSGGLSIGINLNPNNACNWRCIYCQVPELKRGSAPLINFDLLGKELRCFLSDVIEGDFYDAESVPDKLRMIKDIALSGNGEPTTSSEFDQVVQLINIILNEFGLINSVNVVLITNGSQINRKVVQTGLKTMAKINGEVWFKIDSASRKGQAFINQVQGSGLDSLKRLKLSAELCPTYIQTCFFAWKDRLPSEHELKSYFSLLEAIELNAIPIKGLKIYGIARESQQEEAKDISSLPSYWFNDLEEKLKRFENFDISITP